MFPLHDRTKRIICRSTFLLAGVVPLIATLTWCAWANSAGCCESLREHLRSVLNADVKFSDVRFPRPNVSLISNLEVTDRNGAGRLLQSRLAEIAETSAGTAIQLSQPELAASALEALLLLAGSRPGRASVQLLANEIAIQWPRGEQTLIDCACEISGDRIQTCFKLPGNGTQAVRLAIKARADGSARQSSIELDTGGALLPCSLLAAVLGHSNQLGRDPTFRGKGSIATTSSGWEAQISGQFDGLDLGAIVSDQFPHQLAGRANLTVDRAIIRNGRLEEADGKLQAGPGIISRSLIIAASESLGMRSAPSIVSDVMRYDELAASFVLDAKGIRIRGQCGGAIPGTILCSLQAPLLLEAICPAVPIAALVRTLVPDSRVQVPATRQTDWLLEMLPLPDVQPRDGGALPQARLRGGAELR